MQKEQQELLCLGDVDKTFIIKREYKNRAFYGINKPAIEELKGRNIFHIFLFTNMRFEDMDKLNSQGASIEDCSYNCITRYHLIEFLQNEGFTVHGVITPADVGYNKGLGAAYNDFYLPAYKACLEDPKKYEVDKLKANSLAKQFYFFTDKIVQLKGCGSLDLAARQKHFMFHYFKGNVPPQFKNSKIIYFEDHQPCIDSILAIDPDVEAKLITGQDDLPLYIPNWQDYETLSKLFGLYRPHAHLYPTKLSSEQSTALITKELGVLNFWHQNVPLMQELITKAPNLVSDRDFIEFKERIITTMAKDPGSARRTLTTFVSYLIETLDPQLSNAVRTKPMASNQLGFSSSCTTEVIFDYFPLIHSLLLSGNSLQINQIVCNMYKVLKECPEMSQEKLTEIQSRNNVLRPGFKFWGENQRLEGYRKLAIEMTQIASDIYKVPQAEVIMQLNT